MARRASLHNIHYGAQARLADREERAGRRVWAGLSCTPPSRPSSSLIGLTDGFVIDPPRLTKAATGGGFPHARRRHPQPFRESANRYARPVPSAG